MINSYEALSLILDSMTEHIVVIDETGKIIYANKRWEEFGANNNCTMDSNWIGINYLNECDKASKLGDNFGLKAGKGIRSVINKKQPIFYFEYPCHSRDTQRWFMMRVTPLQTTKKNYFVITHQNITERKLAEEEIRHLARTDGLTNIPNRRTFNDFLNEEWRRCARLKKSISLAIVDVDHFKLLNDTYGHQAGDDCLVKIGAVLSRFNNRPTDICARYGGEEFALVWGDTSLKQAKKLSHKLLKEISALKIANNGAPTEDHVTISIGLAETVPCNGNDTSTLIHQADRMLYRAKKSGRNRVEA